MLRFAILILSLSFASASFAEKVDVKDVDASEEGTTTIEIRKGKKEPLPPPDGPTVQRGTTLHEETTDVDTDPAPTEGMARKLWRQACKDAEKKTRDEGKENGDKIFGWNCGQATCSGDAGKKVCVSTAKYKVRSKND